MKEKIFMKSAGARGDSRLARVIMAIVMMFTLAVSGAWAAGGIYCTASDLGKVLCTDGSIVATVSDATAAGKTTAAVITYVDETNNKGLAIALDDDGEMDWNTASGATGAADHAPAVTGLTWILPSNDDWQQMLTAVWNDDEEDYDYYYANLNSMINAAGGAALLIDNYWTSFSTNAGGFNYAGYVRFRGNGKCDSKLGLQDETYHVRAVLAFDIATGPVAVSGVSLDVTKGAVTVGGTPLALTATVEPENAADQTVTWSVTAGADKVALFSDVACSQALGTAAVAAGTVYVQAVALGQATVTVTTTDGGKSASCALTLKDTYSVTMKEGTEAGWTIDPTEAKPGNQVTATYSGDRHVKRLKVKNASKPAATVSTAPSATANVGAGLTTALVTAGTAEGGTMMYQVTTDNTQPTSTDGFSADVPTAASLAAGTCYVWYYVKADDTHIDSEISATAVTVQVYPTVKWNGSRLSQIAINNPYGWAYNNSISGITVTGSGSNGSWMYGTIDFGYEGDASFTFTSSVGNILSIVITAPTDGVGSVSDGWSKTASELAWSGTPAPNVYFGAEGMLNVSQVVFIVMPKN